MPKRYKYRGPFNTKNYGAGSVVKTYLFLIYRAVPEIPDPNSRANKR